MPAPTVYSVAAQHFQRFPRHGPVTVPRARGNSPRFQPSRQLGACSAQGNLLPIRPALTRCGPDGTSGTALDVSVPRSGRRKPALRSLLPLPSPPPPPRRWSGSGSDPDPDPTPPTPPTPPSVVTPRPSRRGVETVRRCGGPAGPSGGYGRQKGWGGGVAVRPILGRASRHQTPAGEHLSALHAGWLA